MIKLFLLTLTFTLIFSKENEAQVYRVTNQNNEPIPYTVIYDLESEKAELTDETGLFRSKVGKKVLFSSLGYLQDTVLLKASQHTSLIILRRDSLNEKNLKSKDLDFEILENEIIHAGHLISKRNEYFILANDDVSLITKIDNPVNKTVQLKQVRFKLKIDESHVLRFRAMSIHPETGAPDQNLLQENIIMRKLNLIGKYKMDLSDFTILLPPEGAFIGFDILPIGDIENIKIKVKLTSQKENPESYIGAIFFNKWTLFNTRMKKQKPKGNFMFGIKAIY